MEMGNINENDNNINIKNNNFNLNWKFEDLNEEKFMASFILSAVGDIVGFNNRKWEFNYKCQEIHQEFNKITQNKGMSRLNLDPSWIVSDDTIMHLATAQAFINRGNVQSPKQLALELFQEIAKEYKQCLNDMKGRAPGQTCIQYINKLDIKKVNDSLKDFNDRGGGCGASMRSHCLGLIYHEFDLNEFQKQQNSFNDPNFKSDFTVYFDHKEAINENLINIAIRSAAMSHCNPIGYLGAVMTALFTKLAFHQIDINLWMAYFLLSENQIRRIINSLFSPKQHLHKPDTDKFFDKCKWFVEQRKLSTDINKSKMPEFPKNYGIEQRMNFYNECSFGNWAGANGCDSVLISYDALLGANWDWNELALRAFLHGGDNDSTGAISAAWFGAYNGFKNIPEINYYNIEIIDRIYNIAQKIYKIYYKNKN